MSKVTFKGKTYTLTQDAHIDSSTSYKALAKDEAGNEYMVYWPIKEFDSDSANVPEDEMCDWDKPSDVVAI